MLHRSGSGAVGPGGTARTGLGGAPVVLGAAVGVTVGAPVVAGAALAEGPALGAPDAAAEAEGAAEAEAEALGAAGAALRSMVTFLISGAFSGRSRPAIFTLAISWTRDTGPHSPKIV